MNNHDLIDFVEETTGERHFRVEQDYGNGFVRLESSEAERRQAKQDIRCIEDAVIEMLRNSRDAGAHLMFVATGRSGSTRTVTIVDDGQGIPAELHNLVFEPRVTSKLDTFHTDRWGVHGRGMALFSIRENVTSAKVCASEPGMGCALQVVSDAAKLPEKADQSSMPQLVSDEGRTVFRGPRNINRTVGEFALDERASSLVFLGSGVEIAATMYDFGCKALPSKERIFHGDMRRYPLHLRLSLCSDPSELAALCQELGIEMSERSARRIMDGQIAPLKPFAQVMMKSGRQVSSSKGRATDGADGKAAGHGMKAAAASPLKGKALAISQEHRQLLQDAVQESFPQVAEAYYLNPRVTPEVSVRRGELVIRIPLVPDDE